MGGAHRCNCIFHGSDCVPHAGQKTAPTRGSRCSLPTSLSALRCVLYVGKRETPRERQTEEGGGLCISLLQSVSVELCETWGPWRSCCGRSQSDLASSRSTHASANECSRCFDIFLWRITIIEWRAGKCSWFPAELTGSYFLCSGSLLAQLWSLAPDPQKQAESYSSANHMFLQHA